jgi:putative N6-adenine-specific DNA methylase
LILALTRFYATAALGTADLVARELRALGFAPVRYDAGGATFDGDGLGAGMKACLHLRAAMRVLWPLARFRAADADGLYQGASTVAWEDHLTTETTFAVSASTGAAPPLAHAPFLGQRVKDAVVDRLRARFGARPDVSRDDPDVRVYVHLSEEGQASVGLDVSGESLHLRGYRVAPTPAPLRETLAAAVLLASEWRADAPLLDPMCGSGTIAIEAALLAGRVAPGLSRRFGFERWPGFDRAAWEELRAEARGRIRPPPAPIMGRDREPDAVAAARRNAAAAGVSVEWSVADVREMAPPRDGPPGIIVTNPPYGERLEGSPVFWRTLGTTLRRMRGWTAFVLVPPWALPALGLRPSWQRRLKNGPITVSLCRFELGKR